MFTQIHTTSCLRREQFARSHKLCINCLNSLYKTSDCKSIRTCLHCSSKLHLEFNTLAVASNIDDVDDLSPEDSTPSNSLGVANLQFIETSHCTENVVLSAALGRLRNSVGEWTPIQVLLARKFQS